jgi:hypothetical protein
MHLPSPALQRFSVVVASATLLLMAAGAIAGGASPDSGLPAMLVKGRIHLELAAATGVATVLMLIWLLPANIPAWVRAMGWVAVGLFAADSTIMAWTPFPPGGVPLTILHAIVAPLFLSSVIVIAFYTPQDWINGPTIIDTTTAWPSLPLAARLTPLLVILQISLGAAYRHKIFGVMPHMAGAMLVVLALLVVSVLLLQSFPTHPTLRPVAIAAMSVVLLQVSLGITAFVMRLMDFDTGNGFVFLAAAHVCVGALTLAASIVLALEVRRCSPVNV